MKYLVITSLVLWVIIVFLLWELFGHHISFSFFPKLAREEKQNKNVHVLVPANKPLQYKTNGREGKMYIIPNSGITVLNSLTIEARLSIDTTASNSSSGIFIANTVDKIMPEKDKASLFLFYYKPANTWALRSILNGKKKYYNLKEEITKGKVSEKFTIEIDKNGKIISISSASETQNIILPSSLYKLTNRIHFSVILEPKDVVSIQQLSYTQQ